MMADQMMIEAAALIAAGQVVSRDQKQKTMQDQAKAVVDLASAICKAWLKSPRKE
jgi:hypothetical protein